MPKKNVREKLLETALQILQLSGFNGCSVNDITKEAGVPKGSFYNHFESKDALALEALEHFFERGAERRALLNDQTIAPVERLQRHFNLLSEAVIKQNFQKGCLIGNFSSEMTSNDDIRHRLGTIYKSWSRSVESCIRDIEEQGRLRHPMSAETAANFLINAWEGAVLRTKVEQNRAPLDQFEHVVFLSLFIVD